MKIQLENGSERKVFDTPSRLVNLRVHDADLMALRGERKVEVLPREDRRVEVLTTQEVRAEVLPRSEARAEVLSRSEARAEVLPRMEKRAEVLPRAEERQVMALDRNMEMSIAADYTAASLGATMAELPARIEKRDKLAAAIYEAQNESIDTIARTASEAIASIRMATDPDDVAEQIEALKKFSENIRNNPEVPEMAELADTIDKFVTIAEKSTGVKRAAKKVAMKREAAGRPAVKKMAPKVERAATKVSKSTAKVVSAKVDPKRVVKPVGKVKAGVKVAKPVAKVGSTKVARPVKMVSRSAKLGAKKVAKPVRHVAVSSDEALEKALQSVEKMEMTVEKTVPVPVRKKKGKAGKLVLALGCAAACVAGIVYFVATNIPDISVRVAALQTGVEASYPSYIPRDFSLKGINSENGKITLTFVGPDNAMFTLMEEKSSWDSAALERNYVKPTWDTAYTTTHEQGITIYMYGANAAWVNGGVLYKINAEASVLTKKQLRNIVTSM